MDIEREEIEQLDKTLEVLNKEISESEESCSESINYVRELSKYHWDYRAEMDDIELATSRYLANQNAELTNKRLARLRKLMQAKSSPYFGKINFTIDDEGYSDQYYVGITNISNGDDV